MTIFLGCLNCDIGCTILCNVHLGLNSHPFGIFFLGFQILKCKFLFFISLFPSFSNIFEYNVTIFESHPEKTVTMTSKKVHYSVFLPFKGFIWGNSGNRGLSLVFAIL